MRAADGPAGASSAEGAAEDLGPLRERVARARRGFVAGAVLGAAGGVALVVVVDARPPTLTAVLGVASIACFSAATGHLVGGGRLGRILASARGWDVAAERIRRAVEDGPVRLARGEEARAARYARVAAILVPALLLRNGAFVSGLLVGQVGHLVAAAVLADLSTSVIATTTIGLVGVVLASTVLPQRIRAARCARAYAEAHPVGAPSASGAGDDAVS